MEEKPVPTGRAMSIEVSERKAGDYPTAHTFFKLEDYKIPRLPLLDDMVDIIKTHGNLPDLSNTVFIGVQHILETTVTLFDALIALGVKPENMFFSGKCYSTSPLIEAQVRKRGIRLMPSNQPDQPGKYEEYCQKGIARMWRTCLSEISGRPVDRIIVFDEGGRCLENIPASVGLKYRIAALEQTRGGLYTESVNLLPFPLVEVASSSVKKILEPPLIAEAIINVVIKKVTSFLAALKEGAGGMSFGLIGNGAIGSAICKLLLSLGHTVAVYDESESSFGNIMDSRFFRMGSVEAVIANSDIIFGCTGKDVTSQVDLRGVSKTNKILVSCTSEDKEFRSLLRTVTSPVDTLSDVVCLTANGRKITVLSGGFPINFDRNPWNVPASKIEVTQGLLLGGCYQAIMCATKAVDDGKTINLGSRQALNPFVQKYVANHWLRRQENYPHIQKCLAFFSSLEAIEKNSGGVTQPNTEIDRVFENALQLAIRSALPKAKL